MLDKALIKDFIEKKLEGSDLYLVNLEIEPGNRIIVELDSDTAVDLNECVKLTREIESEFDRDKEDYELEVGSTGITSPLRLPRQLKKFIGKDMEVITSDSKKVKGVLTEADDTGFALETVEKIKPEGAKRPVATTVTRRFEFDGIKEIKYDLKF